MWGFGRKKKQRSKAPGTADTFVVATGGGWNDPPDVLPANCGTHAEYVHGQLKNAREYAKQYVRVGEEFDYRITDVPMGITRPHEIIYGLIRHAKDYGLDCSSAHDEIFQFRRID